MKKIKYIHKKKAVKQKTNHCKFNISYMLSSNLHVAQKQHNEKKNNFFVFLLDFKEKSEYKIVMINY